MDLTFLKTTANKTSIKNNDCWIIREDARPAAAAAAAINTQLD
jgi:hypothetical protein